MYILWIMFAFLFLYILLVVKGPSVWDRLLGLSLISTKIIIIILLFASIFQMNFLLDIAIAYALLGFISIIFIAIFLNEKNKEG